MGKLPHGRTTGTAQCGTGETGYYRAIRLAGGHWPVCRFINLIVGVPVLFLCFQILEHFSRNTTPPEDWQLLGRVVITRLAMCCSLQRRACRDEYILGTYTHTYIPLSVLYCLARIARGRCFVLVAPAPRCVLCRTKTIFTTYSTVCHWQMATHVYGIPPRTLPSCCRFLRRCANRGRQMLYGTVPSDSFANDNEYIH